MDGMKPPRLLAGETLDDLQLKGLRIIQSESMFKFGMDSVLLADFAAQGVKRGSKVVDLGTGSGVLMLLMWGKTGAGMYTGVEILEAAADMARRSVEANGLADAMSVICADLIDAPRLLGYGGADYVVSNPPYSKRGSGDMSESAVLAQARHETARGFADTAAAASALLKNGSKAAFVLPAERFIEAVMLMREHRLEPKRVRMVHSFLNRPPHIMLVEGAKNSKEGVRFLPPLIIYDADGRPTRELDIIYGREAKV